MSKGELQWSTIVYAILALVVLAVIIGVFYFLTKGPIKGLFGLGDDATQKTNELTLKINNLLGGCDPAKDADVKCSFGKQVKCGDDGKWAIVGDCTE